MPSLTIPPPSNHYYDPSKATTRVFPISGLAMASPSELLLIEFSSSTTSFPADSWQQLSSELDPNVRDQLREGFFQTQQQQRFFNDINEEVSYFILPSPRETFGYPVWDIESRLLFGEERAMMTERELEYHRQRQEESLNGRQRRRLQDDRGFWIPETRNQAVEVHNRGEEDRPRTDEASIQTTKRQLDTTTLLSSSSSSEHLTFRKNPKKASSLLSSGSGSDSSWSSSLQRNRTWKFVTSHPSTTLLFLLNVGLTLAYWYYRVDPHAVAKIYSRMVSGPYYEVWRSLTGATAHFEPLHLGFNMMSLLALGTELERTAVVGGSIAFLLHNISFIPIITVVMMALVCAQLWYYNSRYHNSNNGSSTRLQQLRDKSTVGYSGVLFAWMVVASLEREQTCPIIFLPDVCFSTYSIGGGILKFNMGPWIQLVVAQVILPRVSFVGHLAGIIAGFLWAAVSTRHGLPVLWLLPWIQPSVLIPFMMLVYFRYVRNILGATRAATTRSIGQQQQQQQEQEELQLLVNNSDTTSNQQQHVRMVIRNGSIVNQGDSHRITAWAMKWLWWKQACINFVLVFFLSFVMDTATRSVFGMILPVIPQLTLHYYCLVEWHQYFATATASSELLSSSRRTRRSSSALLLEQRVAPLVKVLVVALVLNIIMDSMTNGTWLWCLLEWMHIINSGGLSNVWFRVTSAKWTALLWMLWGLRILVQLLELCICCHYLLEWKLIGSCAFDDREYEQTTGADGRRNNGILEYTLGYTVLRPAARLGSILLLSTIFTTQYNQCQKLDGQEQHQRREHPLLPCAACARLLRARSLRHTTAGTASGTGNMGRFNGELPSVATNQTQVEGDDDDLQDIEPPPPVTAFV